MAVMAVNEEKVGQCLLFCRSMSSDIYTNWDQTWRNKRKYLKSSTYLVGGFNPSEKYEFVSWGDDIPNILKNKHHVPVTTNQLRFLGNCHPADDTSAASGHPALSKTLFKKFLISGSFTAPPSLGFAVSHHQCSWRWRRGNARWNLEELETVRCSKKHMSTPGGI